MSDLIEILPENVANQIAAGEVVQRPASIVKELMENAVDAHADNISVVIKDGGRMLVRILDNGSGMSAADALRCFARHATSKIRSPLDLFALQTFGFRGEALASIASVAEVEMRTRRPDDQIGTQVTISGSTPAASQSISCAEGTDIAVRNLFFNTPARRKFLKSAPSETKHILTEFQRVAFCNPDKNFSLAVDDKTLYTLSGGSLHQRIVALTSRRLGDKLLDIAVDTPVVRISGYIGVPATAKKSNTDQMLFVNGRYFRSPYMQKAIINGYSKLLPYGYTPAFFVYIDVDPSRLDVNIHPQKTEVKFEDEQVIWQMLSSAVARSLGKHNIVPMLDFDNDASIEIPIYNSTTARGDVPEPAAASNPDYNPFTSYDRAEWDAPATPVRRPSSPPISGPTVGGGHMPRTWGNDPERAPFTETIPPELLSAKGANRGYIPPKYAENTTDVESQYNDQEPVADFESGMSYSDDSESSHYQNRRNSGYRAAESSAEVELSSSAVGFDYGDFDGTGNSVDSDFSDPVAVQATLDLTDAPGGDTLALTIQHAAGRYIVATTPESVLVIDQLRARHRILYEKLLDRMENDFSVGQRELFPESITLSVSDHYLLVEHSHELASMGFDIRDMGGQSVVVYGLPIEMQQAVTSRQAVEELLAQLKSEGNTLRSNRRESLARAMSRNCVPRSPHKLSDTEAGALVSQLLSCDEPSYTPDGRPVMTAITNIEIEKRLRK